MYEDESQDHDCIHLRADDSSVLGMRLLLHTIAVIETDDFTLAILTLVLFTEFF